MPISDIVFLEGHDHHKVMNSDNPNEYGHWFRAKNIDMIPLSTLGELLGVAPYKALMDGFQPVVPPEGEDFLLTFPQNLQDRIRTLDDLELPGIVERWAKTDEFGSESWEDPLMQYLSGLRDFLNSREGYAHIYLCV